MPISRWFFYFYLRLNSISNLTSLFEFVFRLNIFNFKEKFCLYDSGENSEGTFDRFKITHSFEIVICYIEQVKYSSIFF